MQEDSKRKDLFDEYAGSGVIGRMADVLTQKGIPTNTFSIDGAQVALIGEAGEGGPSPFTLSSNGLAAFNQNPEVPTESIKALNSKTTAESGFFAGAFEGILNFDSDVRCPSHGLISISQRLGH